MPYLPNSQYESALTYHKSMVPEYVVGAIKSFKWFLFACTNHELMGYFIIAEDIRDAILFLSHYIAGESHDSLRIIFQQSNNVAQLQHPEFGWMDFTWQHRNIGRCIIEEDTQYGVITTAP